MREHRPSLPREWLSNPLVCERLDQLRMGILRVVVGVKAAVAVAGGILGIGMMVMVVQVKMLVEI